MKPWRQIRDGLFTPEEQLAHNEEAKRILDEMPLAAGEFGSAEVDERTRQR